MKILYHSTKRSLYLGLAGIILILCAWLPSSCAIIAITSACLGAIVIDNWPDESRRH